MHKFIDKSRIYTIEFKNEKYKCRVVKILFDKEKNVPDRVVLKTVSSDRNFCFGIAEFNKRCRYLSYFKPEKISECRYVIFHKQVGETSEGPLVGFIHKNNLYYKSPDMSDYLAISKKTDKDIKVISVFPKGQSPEEVPPALKKKFEELNNVR